MSMLLGVCGYVLSSMKANVYLYLDSALTATPFFCFGYLMNRYANILQPNKYDRFIWLFVVVCMALVWFLAVPASYVTNRFEANSFFNIYIAGIAGTLMTLFIAKTLHKLPLVSYWGRYSIIILCLHMPVLNVLNKVIVHFVHEDAWIQMFATLVVTMLLFLLIIPFMKRFFPYVTAQKDVIRL